jgi:hypothetical protein
MHDIRKQESFVTLRSEGKAFKAIGEEIGVSVPILRKWEVEFEKQIAESRYLLMEVVVEKFRAERMSRVTSLISMLGKISREIESRDLGEVPIKELLQLQESLRSDLKSELSGIVIREPIPKDSFFESIRPEKSITLLP